MSLENSKRLSNPKQPELIELVGEIPLSMDKTFIDKVKYLCKNIPKVEWSGILFYSVEGDISDISTMKIICRDIFLMDIGSATYTEYSFDEKVVDYRMNNPESFTWLMGHIHSHNIMRTFFSGTDMDELFDNAPNHNFYLSLIVNNFMDMIAKVAFIGKSKGGVVYESRNSVGDFYSLKLGKTPKDVLFTYDCSIIKFEEDLGVPEAFEDRYTEIVEENIRLQQERQALALKNPQPLPGVIYKGAAYFPNRSESQQKLIQTGALFEDELADIPTIDKFLCFVFRLGNSFEKDSIEDALEDLEASKMANKDIEETILHNFPSYFDTFYDNLNFEDSILKFLDELEQVIERLEEFEEEFDFINGIILGLRQLGFQLETVNQLENNE